jgi:hypothetical protein
MKTNFIKIATALLLAQQVWALTEVKSFVHTQGSTYHSVSVSFDLTDKELVNEDKITTGLDEAFGISIENNSTCAGSSPYGPVMCPSSIYSLNHVISADELTVSFYIYNSPNPYAHTHIFDYKIQISYNSTVDVLFDGPSKAIQLHIPATQWADIHYKINNGSQLNYRMLKNGDFYTHKVQAPIQNGDVIAYRTTTLNLSGVAVESAWETFTVSGILPFLAPATILNNVISVISLSNVDWIIAHYSINGSSQYNRTMQSNATNHSVLIPEQTLVTGDVVQLHFTYHVNGSATTTSPVVLEIQ